MIINFILAAKPIATSWPFLMFVCFLMILLIVNHAGLKSYTVKGTVVDFIHVSVTRYERTTQVEHYRIKIKLDSSALSIMPEYIWFDVTPKKFLSHYQYALFNRLKIEAVVEASISRITRQWLAVEKHVTAPKQNCTCIGCQNPPRLEFSNIT